MKISIVMVIYSLIRAIFYLMNHSLFPDIDVSQLVTIFISGLRFDLSAILYFNLLYILLMLIPIKARHNKQYIKYTNILFAITNGLGIFINSADIIYYRFTSRRTTFMIFKEFENETNYAQLIYHFFIDYFYIVIIIVVLIVGLVYFSKKLKPGKIVLSSWKYYVFHASLFPIVMGLVVIGLRGGLPPKQDFPLNPSDAGQYVKHPNDVAIVLNTPFTLLLSSDKPSIDKHYYYKDENELNSIYNPIHKADTSLVQKKINVIILMVESLGRETLGYFNKDLDNGNYKGYTPFLDSLCEKSLIFKKAYANSTISIEGTPAVAASIPSMQESFTVSLYWQNDINSIASCLDKIGYKTWYFHGAPNGSLGLNSFAKQAGFKNYIGKNEYNNNADFDGVWGIWDHKFLPFVTNYISEKQEEPFLSYIFTASSHHPYKIPKELEDKFSEGKIKIHRSIRYADYSLKQFFKSAEKKKWYRNTIFVITGDHNCAAYKSQFKTTAGKFSVPIIIYKPESELVGMDLKEAQQIDIMPTILNYLGCYQLNC